MRIRRIVFGAILFLLGMGNAYAGDPKITQAALVSFKENKSVNVIAVEEFGKPYRLQFLDNDYRVLYSESFELGSVVNDFSFLNPFLRFRVYEVRSLPAPIVMAVLSAPSAHDYSAEITLFGEKNGIITAMTPEFIRLSTQDSIYLGHINKRHGAGLVICRFLWGEEGWRDPHRYEVSLYKWNQHSSKFRLVKKLETTRKYRNCRKALRHFGLPQKNDRDEVVQAGKDFTTLGLEDILLRQENEN